MKNATPDQTPLHDQLLTDDQLRQFAELDGSPQTALLAELLAGPASRDVELPPGWSSTPVWAAALGGDYGCSGIEHEDLLTFDRPTTVGEAVSLSTTHATTFKPRPVPSWDERRWPTRADYEQALAEHRTEVWAARAEHEAAAEHRRLELVEQAGAREWSWSAGYLEYEEEDDEDEAPTEPGPGPTVTQIITYYGCRCAGGGYASYPSHEPGDQLRELQLVTFTGSGGETLTFLTPVRPLVDAVAAIRSELAAGASAVLTDHARWTAERAEAEVTLAITPEQVGAMSRTEYQAYEKALRHAKAATASWRRAPSPAHAFRALKSAALLVLNTG